MLNPAQHSTSVLGSRFRGVVFALAAICALTVAVTQSSRAQTFTVIHNFTCGLGGYQSGAGVRIDKAGILYGTTVYGGSAVTVGSLPTCVTFTGTANVAIQLEVTTSGTITTFPHLATLPV